MFIRAIVGFWKPIILGKNVTRNRLQPIFMRGI